MIRKALIWIIAGFCSISVIVAVILMTAYSCKKDIMLPSVWVNEFSELTETSFTAESNIIYDGGDNVTERGICWSLKEYPTKEDNNTRDGKGDGTFFSKVSDLSPTSLYYVRAYATNSAGTAYSKQVSVHTWSGTMKDIDENTYYTITIGSQEWMGENLRTTRLNDGQSLDKIQPTAALSTPGYLFYNQSGTGAGNVSTADLKVYGAIYNGYAVMTDKLCPDGWHLPDYDDWFKLTTYLGSYSRAGGKMKESGTRHWQSPNTGATNESGFTAVPGGSFSYNMGGCGGPGAGGWGCFDLGSRGFWWSSSLNKKDFKADSVVFYVAVLTYDSTGIYPGSGSLMEGRSVRCIKYE